MNHKKIELLQELKRKRQRLVRKKKAIISKDSENFFDILKQIDLVETQILRMTELK